MNFDEVIQLQVLKLKAMSHGVGSLPASVVDSLADQSPQLRQMCAKVSPALYDELETVCNLLDMSKRQFIEGAVADALDRARDTMTRLGALEQGEL